MRGEVSSVRYLLTAIGFLLTLTEWKLRAVGCRLLAPGPDSRLPAVGYRLLAFGYRRAFGNPPSPLRGPLPPDKQWGAREYIGARHLVSFGVGREGSCQKTCIPL